MQRGSAASTRRALFGGIRVQLLLPAVALLAVTMLLIALATLQVSKRELVGQAHQLALSHASVLVEQIDALPEQERERALRRYAQSAGLDLAAWREPGGALYASHEGELLSLCMTYLASQGPNQMRAQRFDVGESTFLFVSLRGRTGMAIVALDLMNVQQSLALVKQSSWLFILLNTTLLLVLGYAVFTYLVIRPIKALGTATERAAQGDFASPVNKLPRNELGQLGHSFNQMLARLDAQHRQLSHQVEALEQANGELRLAQDSLIRSEKLASVGQLAAGVAHEVGNPLAAVYGYSELLAEGDLDDQSVREMGERIRRQVERMRVIIRELLDFSRDEGGEALTPLELSHCVSEAVHLAQATGRLKRATICFDAAEKSRVMGVGPQIVQVLINLLLNAADAHESQDGEALTITLTITREDAGEVKLLVSDDGPGIPAELRKRIFDPFFTTKAPGKGTGLGLAIALKIMRRMGGDLELVESARGASFALRFDSPQALPEPR